MAPRFPCLVPLVWESNPKLQGGWCKPNHQPIGGSDPNHPGIWSPPRAGRDRLPNNSSKCKRGAGSTATAGSCRSIAGLASDACCAGSFRRSLVIAGHLCQSGVIIACIRDSPMASRDGQSRPKSWQHDDFDGIVAFPPLSNVGFRLEPDRRNFPLSRDRRNHRAACALQPVFGLCSMFIPKPRDINTLSL